MILLLFICILLLASIYFSAAFNFNAARIIKSNLFMTPARERYAEKMEKVLFVEAGFGCDQHGQNSTKAAVRACRNAIEFNSLPALRVSARKLSSPLK